VNWTIRITRQSWVMALLVFDTARGVDTRACWIGPASESIAGMIENRRLQTFFTATRGSAQRLPNGNTLIVEGERGRTFELTPQGEMGLGILQFRVAVQSRRTRATISHAEVDRPELRGTYSIEEPGMTDRLCKPWEHRLSRRAWMGGLSLGAAGIAAGSVPFGTGARGGVGQATQASALRLDRWRMSQYESWDPKPNTPFGGPSDRLRRGARDSGVRADASVGKDHAAFVRRARHVYSGHSHSAGVPRIQRGDPKNRGVTYPFFGSAVAKLVGSQGTGCRRMVDQAGEWWVHLSGRRVLGSAVRRRLRSATASLRKIYLCRTISRCR